MKRQKKKNYISIRIEVAKSGQLNHDVRQKKENYIIDGVSNIFLDDNFKSIIINNNESEKIHRFKRYIQIKKNELIKSVIDDAHQHNKRAIQKRTNLELSGIITFSDTMRKDYENNPDEFLRKSIELLQAFEREHNTKIINSSIHLDETTPHIHFSFINYDFKKHRTLKRTMDRTQLEDLQDLGEKYFIDYESGYHRGEKVSSTGSKHQSVKQSHSIEQFKKDIEAVLNTQKMTLNDLQELRQVKRQETKLLTNKDEIESNKEILKQLSKKINSKKRVIKTINQNISKILDKNLGIFGVDRKQLEIDLSHLLEHKIEKGDVLQLLEELETQLNKTNVEKQELKSEIISLQDKVEDTQQKNIEQRSGVISQNIKIVNLENNITNLKDELQMSQNDIKTLKTFINQDLERKSQYQKFLERREGNYLEKKREEGTALERKHPRRSRER